MHRRTVVAVALAFLSLLGVPRAGLALAAPQFPEGMPFVSDAEVLLAPGVTAGLPVVVPNDNTSPAGATRDGVRIVELEVVAAAWLVEYDGGPGLRVNAVAEAGGSPRVPAPLLRVPTGTPLRVSVTNRTAAPVTVVGLHSRPGPEDGAPFVVAPGATETVEFDAGEPGTYLYTVREWDMEPAEEDLLRERTQLVGAFVVDPAGGSPPDRVLVMNIFGQPALDGDGGPHYREGLAINGRSFPYSELMGMEVGERQRWRVVNGSDRNHPMHLHGFFYEIHSLGKPHADVTYAPEERRLVVTETMMGQSAMVIEWTPSRPGRWLFHCHLSFHVSNEIRLPGAAEADPDHAHAHMAGLVLGIDVAPGPTDLTSRGEVKTSHLWTKDVGDETGYRYAFTTAADAAPANGSDAPGPLLVFNQYDAVDMTVHNDMARPTGIHWHGLELDAWADGVPEWSASDGKMSPVIAPGDEFTYRLSMMRPGTFIYHSHLDDIDQLTGGLYGPLVVLPPGETFDPRTDHPLVWGWRTPGPQGPDDFELNGHNPEQPPATARVGETHRFRLVNIAPAGRATAWITRDDEVVPIRLLAKDGADLPASQQVDAERAPRIGVGETADFTWTPTEPGEYRLMVGYPDPDRPVLITQLWTVLEAEGDAPPN